jgi:hypothetical protein
MGGALQSAVVGEGPGKVSADASKLKAFVAITMAPDSGNLFILESDGSTSDIEVLQFKVDFLTKETTYTSTKTVSLGSINAVDIVYAPLHTTYYLKPDTDLLAVLIRGASGGYIRIIDTKDFNKVEDIGSASTPSIPGTAVALDMESVSWQMAAVNQEDTAVVFSWVL